MASFRSSGDRFLGVKNCFKLISGKVCWDVFTFGLMGILVSIFTLSKLNGKFNLKLFSTSWVFILLIPALPKISSGFRFKNGCGFKFISSAFAKFKPAKIKKIKTQKIALGIIFIFLLLSLCIKILHTNNSLYHFPVPSAKINTLDRII